MKVLSVSSEVFPLIKTGGLADVSGALPIALKAFGVETKTLLPGYPAVMKVIRDPVVRLEFPDLLGEPAAVLEVQHEGLDLLILDAPAYYDRPGGPYVDPLGKDYPDNWRRFAALSLAASEIAAGLLPGWRPDLVHTHDWQAALTSVYMRYYPTPELPSVLTIHNIAFQGQFGPEIFPGLRLPAHAFATDSIEYYGTVGYLKGGLQTAHAITTVSPTYADEILTPEFGMGLEGVIASHIDNLHGIVNGIDTDIWNPATDPVVHTHYGPTTLKNREENRRSIAEFFHLDNDDAPIFCVISRLTWQKGMDIVANIADEIVAMGGKLVVLGSGEAALEGALLASASRHPGRIGVSIGYNEPMSHLMQAGCDAIIIPSRFEPCGLTQLYGLRYGCVPIVARTGGLNDTVIDANHAALAAKVATGIQFSPVTETGMLQAIRRAMHFYADRKLWTQLQKQGMKSDVSWEKSAERYAALYSSLVSKGM
ncbi:starch synthase [Rhizobium leguminosarum]|uniref:Glycogen synthase n=3 Tax=Rhizobium TaxID=379 RepID=GLGA_RHILW|nr:MULTISPECIES: glycogen synthase GlgA [Rhizobium]B5ZQ47.1 RecName: Full=Glycogen synthase; AltName: Full=Starch [bacterial glycogen] synthase [Rhizobium leguminosarum bv. trifolii WSM2304]ACI56617.1 glycogen/starch synthase, ADP-glucose type [Rhizobium leguminosarum bv. trifolii WSM2304]KPH06863.1 glycogen synthase [Rhizobium acidisoli]NYJ12760.1 starch synthase [Rhizobium leguminosarum]QAS79701.1 glycogen synthase GlgA [Rhizobium acidisoli]